ncbi:MAG: hypothetical protein AAF629_29265, partial [Chloroflexota bacterium]
MNDVVTTVDYALFAQAFPFHIVVDARLQIVQYGPSLAKLKLGIATGALFSEIFEIARPSIEPSYEAIIETADAGFLIACRNHPIQFRYQVLHDQQHKRLFFVGSPAF